MFRRSYSESVVSRTTEAADDETNLTTQRTANQDNSTKDLPNVTTAQQQPTRASKSQKLQFRASFCEIVIAISTIRGLTSSSSSTAATTATYSPLISLLKLFLVGCNYLLAFASILMLIIYINHLGNHQRNDSKQPETIMSHTNMLNTHHNTSPSTDLGHNRAKRSIPEVENIRTAGADLASRSYDEDDADDDGDATGADELRGASVLAQFHSLPSLPLVPLVTGSLPNKSFSVPIMMKKLESRPTGTRTIELPPHRVQHAKEQQQQNSATNRLKVAESGASIGNQREMIRSYSANNRGSIMASTSTTTPKPHTLNNDQWIPIVGTRAELAPTRQPYGLPAQHQRQLKPPGSHHRPTTGAIPGPALNVLGSEETVRYTRHNRPPRHFELHHHHYHQRAQFPSSGHMIFNRHLRRPRLNPDYAGPVPRMNKIYKIVLLCDKTLVSLDYVKKFHFVPKMPAFHAPDHHDFDENDIDLDSELDPIFAASRRYASTTSNNVTTASASNIELTGATIDSENDHAILSLDRRAYLSEEDPLVRCDMWDLEKGLKNRKPPREILQMAVKVDFDTVRDAINRCRQLSEKMLPPDDEYRDGLEIMSAEDLVSLFSMKRGLIPGTKWCGLGDIASNYNDLGPKTRIDICCRAHDHCPIRLKPFRNDYGVLNIALYTKSHCDCDADFYRCLREVHSRTADMLGNLYFNVMKLQCMREERMKICREMRPIALGFERCVRYEESPMRTVFKFTTPPISY